jgi:hypothetical protein
VVVLVVVDRILQLVLLLFLHLLPELGASPDAEPDGQPNDEDSANQYAVAHHEEVVALCETEATVRVISPVFTTFKSSKGEGMGHTGRKEKREG